MSMAAGGGLGGGDARFPPIQSSASPTAIPSMGGSLMPGSTPPAGIMGMESSSSGAARAGAPTSPTAIDGKQFFRQARSRLSYEAFNAFLANIKRLNNHQQSREETLEEARRLFGTEHADLFAGFQTLLNRHG